MTNHEQTGLDYGVVRDKICRFTAFKFSLKLEIRIYVASQKSFK